MKLIRFSCMVLSALSINSFAAPVCVRQADGTFLMRGGSGQCEDQNLLNKVEAEREGSAANESGTKVVDGIYVTNSANVDDAIHQVNSVKRSDEKSVPAKLPAPQLVAAQSPEGHEVFKSPASNASPTKPASLDVGTVTTKESDAPLFPTSVAASAPVIQHWRIKKGESIATAFKEWCSLDHNYELYWEATDLTAGVDIDLQGKFEDAITKIIEGVNRAADSAALKTGKGASQSTVKLHATFLTANNPKILRVTDK